MSDIDTTDQDQTEEPSHIAQLRAEADEARKLRRENAMLKAGVDTATPVGAMFAKAYDGELDVAAIKAAAEQVGALVKPKEEEPPAPPAPETTATPVEQRQTDDRSIMGLGAPGAEPPPATPKPAREAALAAYDQAVASGKPQTHAAADFINTMIGAANAGDKTATWEGWTPEQLGRKA